MAASPPPKPGRIFIRYRRGETAYAAGWLYDRLADHYGDGQVFKDVDSIELGDDFVEVINGAVGSCDVLLALIGEDWLSITDAHGRRRLDDLLETTDTDTPVPTGGVGLAVTTYQTSRASVAEFDNFVVQQVS
jgi:hypothetical protein